MKRKLFFIILLSLFLSFSTNINAQKERFVLPFDEADKDSSFKAFRDSLIKTVKTKNKTRLINALDKNIKASFGGHEGVKGFKELWSFDKPKTKVWDELLTVLENGGKFSGKGTSKFFCAPYLFTQFPEDVDAFDYEAIFGNNVNLREKPNLSSKVISKLSYNIISTDIVNSVTTTTDANEYVWLKIKTLGGKEGYVSAKYVRSSIDYRACFEKKGRNWKMTAFVAGD